jgi:hypothetical protein
MSDPFAQHQQNIPTPVLQAFNFIAALESRQLRIELVHKADSLIRYKVTHLPTGQAWVREYNPSAKSILIPSMRTKPRQ